MRGGTCTGPGGLGQLKPHAFAALLRPAGVSRGPPVKVNALLRKRLDAAIATVQDSQRTLKALERDLAVVARRYGRAIGAVNRSVRRANRMLAEDQTLHDVGEETALDFVRSLRGDVQTERERLEGTLAELRERRRRVCRRKGADCK